jgi:alcohol dehydrogenase, propanol-preferring
MGHRRVVPCDRRDRIDGSRLLQQTQRIRNVHEGTRQAFRSFLGLTLLRTPGYVAYPRWRTDGRGQWRGRTLVRMRAAILETIPAERLSVGVLPDPTAEPGELLLEILACGICGTDLHILDGASYRPDLPFVLGHEPVGRVLAAGSPSDSAWVDKIITMTLFVGCGHCSLCRSGDERLCADLQGLSGVLGFGGGFAGRMVIRTAQAVALPSGLGVLEAASLVDAGATAANAVKVAATTTPDTLVVIVGGGPVGFFAAELLRYEQRALVVVQRSAARRATLEALGHRVVASLEEISERPGALIDCAAAPGVVPWAIKHLQPRGAIIAAAYGPTDAYSLDQVSRKELTIHGIRSGSRKDLTRVLDLAATGSIRTPPLSTWSLEMVNDALDALRAKLVPGKAVVVPAT